MIGVATPPGSSCDSHNVLPFAGSSAKNFPAELPTKISCPAVDNVPPLDCHGNPNMLTLDKGTSKLAQGPIAQTTLVEVERWQKPVPPIGAYDRPATVGA